MKTFLRSLQLDGCFKCM